MDTCSISGCDRKRKARGLCNAHHRRLLRHGDPEGGAPMRTLYPPGTTCSVDDCPRPVRGRSLCQYHLQHASRYGDPLAPLPKRKCKRSGKRWKNPDGYVFVYWPEHPNARAKGDVPEHVVVMTEALGRRLYRGESIHHRNGKRGDNRLNNLELRSTSHGRGQTVDDLVSFAVEILRTHRPDLLQ